jgi:hypothetical protein
LPSTTNIICKPDQKVAQFTNIEQWAKTWLVDFNPTQTKALIISSNTNIPELNIRFNDESVELVDNHKHLGVTFVADGNWTVHKQ